MNFSTKCIHCKKTKGDHQARTLRCPMGAKTRIGYVAFALTTFHESSKP
jgi:hypothetical protein